MPLAGRGILTALVLSVSAVAQDEDLGTLVGKALAAMKQERWEEAFGLTDQAATRCGQAQALQAFGPQFGAVFYHKGVCEMKLKRWNEAMRSFETCYRDFPNAGPMAEGDNAFQKMALLKWGEAAMGAENWDLAISRFRKFLEERDKERDQFSQGVFHIGMAVCQYRLGRISEGNENLEIAIRNQQGFQTPESGIVAGFQALVSAAIIAGNEQALLDFIGKNRGELIIEPYRMHRYSNGFMKLAGDALEAGMERAAMALYEFAPSTEAALDDTRARMRAMDGLGGVQDQTKFLEKKHLERDLADLEAVWRGGNAPEVVKLAATALVHEKHGNFRGAYAAYQQLERFYPAAEKREDNLYNLVRLSSMVAASPETRGNAEVFLKTFPDSPRVPAVRRFLLSSFSFSGEYESRVEVAAPVIGKLEPQAPKQSKNPFLYPYEPPEYAAAMDFYQARRYGEARVKFSEVRKRFKPLLSLKDNPASLAAFYEMECLRKLGDLEGLAAALKQFSKEPLTRETQLRQLELYVLWDAVRTQSWDRLDRLAGERANTRLPGDQRAQVAWCHGLALEGLNRPEEALFAYQTAMTADAGASEELARQAALRVLAIHQASPDVQAAIRAWGTPDEDRNGRGYATLVEAAAVAEWFEMSLGAGTSLTTGYKMFLRYQRRDSD